VEVSRDAIAESINVDDEELRSLYEQRKTNYRTAEQRDASHILLRLEKDADDAAVAEARDKLAGLKELIEAGTPFEELAREHSEDPGSAKQGGSLGTFGRGVMDPAFETAAFALAEGHVSEPVRSSFGMHLIKVNTIRASVLKSFEQVRDELGTERRFEEAEQTFVDQVEQLATLAFEHPESLDIAAETLGLTPTVSDWLLPVGGTNIGVGANPAVLEAAFSPEVLELGNNSELIELDASRVIVLRVAEHRPTEPQSLDEVSDRIRADLSSREGRKLASETGTGLLEVLRDGEQSAAAVESSGYDWSEEAEHERTARGVNQAVLKALFRMPRPSPGAESYESAVTPSGDFVIIALAGVSDGELGQVAKAEQDTARQSIAAERGRNDYDAMVKGLREAATIDIYRENL
jgi:peptidyl-prolyl cis-trans isomerase D